jgi:DNA primase catalytic core
MITEEIKQRIKESVHIEEVIGEYITLKKNGVNYVGVCPFHNEKTPSFIVSPSKGMYKCFGCGAGGDAIKFIQEHEHVTFPEAVKYLAKRCGIEIQDTPITEEERKAMAERESMLNVNNSVHAIFVNNLYSHPGAVKFLQERNINQETINEFRLGYAPEGNNISLLAASGKINGYYAEKLSLIKKNERGEKYDTFRNRIIYPFLSVSGNIIGFTGRKIDWKKGDNAAKFLNSDESPLFKKDKALFGLYQAKKYIVQHDRVYWVEGQHDVLSMFQNGVKNTVCGSGTAFNSNHVREVMRFTKNITFIFDGDAAGLNATVKAIKTALEEGANIRIVQLPEGEDPDTFAHKNGENLLIKLSLMEQSFIDFILKIRENDLKDEFKKEIVVDEFAQMIALVESEITRKELVKSVSEKLDIETKLFHLKVKSLIKTHEKTWKNGLNGIEEAKEIIKNNEEAKLFLTFKEKYFIENVESEAIVYARGTISKSAIQMFRANFSEIHIHYFDNNFEFGETEHENLLTLKEIFRTGMDIKIENEDGQFSGFLDYYINGYSVYLNSNLFPEKERALIIGRCAEILSFADATVRTVTMKTYAKKLNLTQADMKAVVQPYLEKKKDKTILEKRNLDTEGDLLDFDLEKIPDYVNEDEVLKKTYIREGFYPLVNKSGKRVAYMFRNEKGGGHTCISDFYMEPLLHIYNRDSEANKRVIRLNHIHGESQYVEWKSSIFAALGKVNEKLIDEGGFNFEGNMYQFKRIWKTMSYQFKRCTEMKIFGQQPEDFWAFSNAIVYDETNGNGDTETKIEYADNLGIMAFKDKYYYSPSQSEIYNQEREEDDQFKMERYFVYKEPIQSMLINFDEWAKRMNAVYSVNDNGKWAILMCVLSCFRDYIFSQRRFFTTLFFIGPTGSGKTQIAESMRSLFMAPEAPVFNLNFGSDASFFIVLESYRNVISIMEEYNDSTISPTKFQGLKAAVFDGEGKTKVKDIASKSLDRSKINAVPVILGQEAPQQDDGSLSNRCILCEVPYKPKGDWTEEETAEFEELKRHEQAGLCNVLLEILSLRKIVKKHFNPIFTEEVKAIKTAISLDVTNTEGLTRIVNSIALITSICRLIEEHTPLKLPFTYTEFFRLATEKVLKQVEMISTNNKLANYFAAIGYLINQGRIKIGKELKVVVPKDGTITVKTNANKIEERSLPTPETKVLYIDFGAIYPLYQSTVRDALTKASLQSYFNSNKAFLGLCKSTLFKWYEEVNAPMRQDIDEEDRPRIFPSHELRQVTKNTSAYMFNYDILKELMDIDFEMTGSEQEDKNMQEKEKEYTVPF